VNTDQIKESAALFEHLSVPSPILNALTLNKFIHPTPIQQEVLPVALKGLDVLGSAQTGTGKTLAFAIPLLARLLENQHDCALIIVPTRELATQVQQALQTLIGRDLRIMAALLIGGEPIFRQYRQLRANPRIVVGTPGRIIDHLEQGTYNPKQVAFLVLDEMDRMFDMGFDLQVAEIIRHLSENRQTMMFSATLPKEIEARAQKYLKNPVRISVGPVSTPAANITQEIIHVQEHGKYEALVTQLQKEGSIIVFVKTKMGAARLAERLADDQHLAAAMHGDLRQSKREQVVLGFRKGRFRILVATDIAARGLDIQNIKLVINYDLPQCAEDYIHRIGRTARAGAEGAAVCLIAPHERRLWAAIDRMLNPGKAEVDSGLNSSNGDYQGGRSSRGFGGRGGGGGFKRGGGRGNSRSFSSDRPFSDRKSSSATGGGFSRSRNSSRDTSFVPRDGFVKSSTDEQRPVFRAERKSDTFSKGDGFVSRGNDYKKPYQDKRNRPSEVGRDQSSNHRSGNKNRSQISFFDQQDSFKKRNTSHRDNDRF
jgi:ATP-dependent RNA helicase DeaD